MPDRTRLPPVGTFRPVTRGTPLRLGGGTPAAPTTGTRPARTGSTRPARPPAPAPGRTGGGGAITPSVEARRVVDADVLRPVVLDRELPPPDPSTMTARQMVDEIHLRADKVRQHFHAIGTLLRALDDPPRLRELGCTDVEALLVQEQLGSKVNAHRLAQAAVLPFDLAKSFGQTKSYELVRWARDVRGARTDAAVVEIVRATTEIDGVPLAEITTREIAKVIGRPDPATRAARARTRDRLRDLASDVRRRLKKSGVTSRTTVDDDKARGPALCIRVGSIEDVLRLLAALENDEP